MNEMGMTSYGQHKNECKKNKKNRITLNKLELSPSAVKKEVLNRGWIDGKV